MNDGISVDVSGAKEMFESLSTRKIIGMQKKVLRKAANEVKKEAKSRLRQAMPNASKNNPKYNDTLLDAVKVSVWEDNNGAYSKVHTMGSRKKSSGTFRTRFFEGGTVVRKTGKGQSRGSLKALYFFGGATSATKQKVDSTIDIELSKVIQNIANKKYG